MTKRILIALLVVGLSLCLFPAMQAQAATDSVEIYVGYFGETYVKLRDVSKGEMEGLAGCNEYIYSSIDNGNFTRYQLAYGVPLESLLSYVGIATADVDTMYFLGTDSWVNETFNKPFGVPRYYFPYLAEYYNQADPDASNVAVITSYYEEVPAILAFEQTFDRDTGAFDYDKYKSGMSDENCLRLAFGQQVWNEVTASDSVKWVYRISVNLDGSPITASDWDTQVGSSQALESLYEVNSGYDELNELIKSGMQIWSDNPAVVQVNEATGELWAVGKGDAHIYLEYSDPAGGGTFNAQINVTATENPDPDNQGGGSGEGGWTPPEITDSGGEGDEDDEDDPGLTPDGPNDSGVDDDTDSGSDESDEPDLAPDEPADTDQDDTKTDGTTSDKTDPDDSTPDGTEPGEGAGGDSGYGGEEDDGSNGDASGSGTEDESGTPGVGTEETQTPSGEEGSSGEDNGDEGTDSAAGGVTVEDPGAAERIREGMKAGEESVPLSEEGEAAYDQIKEYMEEQLEGMDEVPDVEQIASLTEDVRSYIEELIEQAEEDDEPLDIEAIIEMVEEYIDEIVEEAEEADEEVVEELSEEETSEDRDSRQGVYLSLGNLNGGDSSGGNVTTNGSMSSGNTAGGSGGKVLEIEPLPIYYTVILIVALSALFVGGGLYRSLRFRRETAER